MFCVYVRQKSISRTLELITPINHKMTLKIMIIDMKIRQYMIWILCNDK